MDAKTKWLAAACVLSLTACASTGTSTGVRVGAAYGHGDYYAGARRERTGDWPWSFSVGMASWGGYCSARYRYCLDPFLYSVAWYGGGYLPYYYDPYWSQPWLYLRLGPPPRDERVPLEPVAAGRDAPAPAPAPEAWPRPRPRSWEERPMPRHDGPGPSRTRARPSWPSGG
jgi:hypothetical protein